jgi:hypothetical protein
VEDFSPGCAGVGVTVSPGPFQLNANDAQRRDRDGTRS